MPTPRLVLFALVVLCLRTSSFGDDAPTPKTVSYEDFKRQQRSQADNRPKLGGKEAIVFDASEFSDLDRAMANDSNESGPALLAELQSDNWEQRWLAAEKLGAIQYHEASTALITLLGNDADWRLSLVSAVALGRMREKAAVPALAHTATTHWYPLVRSAARKALAVISGTATYTPGKHTFAICALGGGMDADFLDLDPIVTLHADLEPSPSVAMRRAPEELTAEALRTISYATTMASYSPEGRRTRIIKATPRCGLKVESGLLLGGDRGEWGGELVFVDDKDVVEILIQDNIIGIHRLPCGIVAAAGCGHLGNRIAHLYLVTRSTAGVWSARKWRSLPAAPVRSGFLPDGRLLIVCANRENVILSPEGRLSMADEPPQR